MDAVWSEGAIATLFSPVRRVYALFGEDDRQKDEAIQRLRQSTVEEDYTDFDVEFIEADSTPVEQILASAGMAPLGSPFRLVVVRGAEIFRKREKQGDAERLATGIGNLGSSSCLAFRIAAAEDEKSRGKTILTAKLDAAIRLHGATVQCKPLTEQGLLDWATARARKAEKRLDSEAGLRLIRAAHSDRNALDNELEKAICYIGDGQVITLEAVEAICSYDPEDVMFKLVDSIAQRSPGRALTLLRELLRYDTKPQSVAGRLLSLLARQFKLLWQARELAERKLDAGALKNLPPHVAEELPSEGSILGMMWRAREIYGSAHRWSRADLTHAFTLLLECDLSNKGGGEGNEDVITNLEILIIKLCQAA